MRQYGKCATFHIINTISIYSLYVIGFRGGDKISETGGYFLHLKKIMRGVMATGSLLKTVSNI